MQYIEACGIGTDITYKGFVFEFLNEMESPLKKKNTRSCL